MELFAIKALSFTYPNSSQKAINQLSLSVNKGDFLLLFGASGCGKTTLLRHFKSVLTPHGEKTGEILFKNQPLETVDERTQSCEIGFVGQSPDNQLVTDKVWHELAFGLENLGFDSSVIRARVAQTASFFGIEPWFHEKVSELSGGQKQILNLAAVMATEPQILILDEPTAQLDPIAAGEFLSLLGKINRELGVTVVLTEHRLEECFPLATVTAVMDGGKILYYGTPRDAVKSLPKDKPNLLLSLPTPARVWNAVDNSLDCPLTVSEGREWLSQLAESRELLPVPAREYPMPSDEIAINAEGLWFKYDKKSPDVVKGLDFKVYKGEFTALTGGNGAGKTTVLKLISGALKPYSGEVTVKGSIGVLPQNPQALFVKNTVREDLYEVFPPEIPKPEQEKAVSYAVTLCRLNSLLDRHPFDLSGGEQQRAALAKVLLTKPDILLLDEPTKGFDAEYKQLFGTMLEKLIDDGVTILTVSHDIEFCARYSHRCALLFDGNIVSEGSADIFFSGNSFYTTAADRMARGIIENALLPEDIITACNGVIPKNPPLPTKALPIDAPSEPAENGKAKLSVFRKITASVFGIASVALMLYAAAKTDFTELITAQGLTALGREQIWLYVAFIFSLFIFGLSTYRKQPKKTALPPASPTHKRLPKRTVISTVLILLCIPLTLLAGIKFFDKGQYYFISFCVLIECMLPFFLVFEGRKPKARELVTIAVLCAVGIAGRAVFFMLPQFKPIAAVVIISGIALGGETGFLVGAVTMLLSNIMFSQGPWTPWQMFAMGIIGFLAGILFKRGGLSRNRISICIFGALAVIIVYGGIMNPVSALLWSGEALGFKALLTYYLTGLPMDIIHAVATFIFLWFGAEPLLEKLERIKLKYEI